MAKVGSGDALACSFCGKSQKSVRKLIAGPGVYICNECVDLCDEILEHEVDDRPSRVMDEDVEAAARAAREAVDRLQRLAQRGRREPDPDDPE